MSVDCECTEIVGSRYEAYREEGELELGADTVHDRGECLDLTSPIELEEELVRLQG